MSFRAVAAWMALALVAGSAGAAQAQTCAASGQAATTCRMMLPQPRAFTIRGVFKPDARSAAATDLAMTVDGRTCAIRRYGGMFGDHVSCRLVLPAGVTTVEVHAGRPGRISVQVIDNGRLAALPREARELDPHAHWPIWARLSPFPLP